MSWLTKGVMRIGIGILAFLALFIIPPIGMGTAFYGFLYVWGSSVLFVHLIFGEAARCVGIESGPIGCVLEVEWTLYLILVLLILATFFGVGTLIDVTFVRWVRQRATR